MKINNVRAFWNFEVNELSTASGWGAANLTTAQGGKNSCYATAKAMFIRSVYCQTLIK